MSPKIFLLGIILAAYASTCIAEGGDDDPKYGYSAGSETGPSNWGKLSPEYKTCSEGKQQSPISIVSDDAKPAPPEMGKLERSYLSSINNSILINTGTHIELKLNPSDGHAKFNKTGYFLDFIRFRTPSEHVLDNKRYPLEAQIVHRDQDDKELVVSILYKTGSPDTFLYKLAEHLKSLTADKCTEDEEAHILIEDNIKTKNLLKSGGCYYGYVGSQTAPPCEEGVLWFISKKVRTVSTEQVLALQFPLPSEFHNNARPVVDKNAVNILKYDNDDSS